MRNILLLFFLCLLPANAYASLDDDIKEGNIESVKQYMNDPENREEMNDAEVLYTACLYGKLDIVRYLLDHGVPINDRGEDNRGALSAAVVSNHMPVVHYLLDHGAQVEDQEGFTVLIDAVVANNTDILDFLLEKGAHINAASCAGDSCTSPLRLAAASGNMEMFMHLVEKGASLTEKLPYDEFEGNLLNSAVFGGNLEIVKYVISKGFDIHYSEKHLKKSLLSSAVNSDAPSVLQVIDYLLQKGLNVNYKDGYKKTVFFDVWTSEYETPKEKEVKEQILLKLLDKGLRIDDVDEVGNTPLHHACDLGFLHVVEYLVKKKAPLLAKNMQQETPLDIARKKEYEDIVAVLEKAMRSKGL